MIHIYITHTNSFNYDYSFINIIKGTMFILIINHYVDVNITLNERIRFMQSRL